MSKIIPLTQGQVAIVCDCHAHLVEGYKWCAHHRGNEIYAKRGASTKERNDGAPHQIYMHGVINNTPPGYYTDHINHNTLDNRCSNLRTATPKQNGQNTRGRKGRLSRFKGVSWRKDVEKWKVAIGVDGKVKHLGLFDSEEEAAKAYKKAAKELFGEFYCDL